MSRSKIIVCILMGLLIALFIGLVLTNHPKTGSAGTEITLYCGAGMRKPVQEIIAAYARETGITVRPNFAGSGELLAQLRIAGGDLYLPADISYIENARKDGLVAEALTATNLTAGILVAKGNPRNIRGLADLENPDTRVCLGNPSAAIGKFSKKILTRAKLWKTVEANLTVTKPTVNGVAQTVDLGAADAAIVWDAVAAQFKNTEFMHVPEFDAAVKHATIGVLTSSNNPTEALRFARFLTARDRGREIFTKFGFAPPDDPADKWERVPEITFFSGSMLRPAIQDQIRAFESREGVRVNTVFEGCGTLVSMMSTGASPDAYFSCDVSFLNQVQDRFSPGTVVAKNEIIILVPKGNPKKLLTLADLTRPGLKIGVAHPQKSALGALTMRMLDDAGLGETLKSNGNIEILASKGDELVNQMQIGALDAALLYRSNALASEQIQENCDIIVIGVDDAIAEQPFAIALESDHPRLMKRLYQTLTNPRGKAEFLKFGFGWQLEENE